jgi:GDSL-like Lipase/Acylhydrolase family
MDASKSRLRICVDWLLRGVPAVVAGLLVFGSCFVGTAHAAPDLSAGAAVGSSFFGAKRSTVTDESPKKCFDTYPTCSSADPDVDVPVVSYGDASGCTWESTVTWGDGKSSSASDIHGGPDGSVGWVFHHEYSAAPKRFTITVDGSVVSSPPDKQCSYIDAVLHFHLEAYYVALGDSYAAGVGSGGNALATCDQRSNAYPEIWHARHPRKPFDFSACTGASTGDISADQLDGITSGTRLISLTAGGDNRKLFFNLVTTCVLSSHIQCAALANKDRLFMAKRFPGDFRALYSAIARHLGSDATSKLVVLDYPDGYAEPDECILSSVLDPVEQHDVNSVANALDRQIRAGVREARTIPGLSDTDFIDVRQTFESHEICSDDPWINGLLIPPGGSYHPNAAGQLAYFRLLEGVAG